MNLPASQADEIFVRVYVQTGEILVAGNQSGIRLDGMSTRESALTTYRRPEIQAAIRRAKLDKKYSDRVEFTNRSIAEDLERVYDEAMAAGDWKACIMAKDSQMKVLGLLVQKVEIGRAKDVGEASTAELERWLRDYNKTIEGDSARVIDAKEVAPPKNVRVESAQEDQ